MNIHFCDSGTVGMLLVGYRWMEGNWLYLANKWISDEWHHVAVTYDGKVLKGYVDAEKVGERASAVEPLAEKGSYIMGRYIGGGYMYHGLLDEVVVFDKVLDQVDIAGIMNKGMTEVMRAVSPEGKLAVSWGELKNLR